MPGYVLSLAPFVWTLGPTHRAAVALNLLLYAAMIVLWKGVDLEEGQKLEAFIAAHTDAYPPKRIVARANRVFIYGLTPFPVQVI